MTLEAGGIRKGIQHHSRVDSLGRDARDRLRSVWFIPTFLWSFSSMYKSRENSKLTPMYPSLKIINSCQFISKPLLSPSLDYLKQSQMSNKLLINV